jgi:homoserine kinase type II
MRAAPRALNIPAGQAKTSAAILPYPVFRLQPGTAMAVYTDVTDSDLEAFMAQYDLGEVLAFKGIAEGVENSNFLLQTDYGNFILTLYEKRVNPAELPFFLGLMEHLAERGFLCPTPIQGRDGTTLRELCGKKAAVISFMEGLSPRTIMPYHCDGLGQVLAQLHVAGADFPMQRPNNLSIVGWRGLIAAIGDQADTIEPGLSALLHDEIAYLDAHWPTNLAEGIIHADLFPDNVFFRGHDVSGVIDFYFACTDALAYDLAICINAWCFDADNRFEPECAAGMVAAYQAVRPMSAEERAAMPILARGAALRFLLTRSYDWLNRQPGAFVKPKNPREYLEKLLFHRAMSGPEAYGL